jgi:hypothetical protein
MKNEISDFHPHSTSNNSSPISMYQNPHLIPPKKSKSSPNCPLIKSPYIKLKLEAKNLEKSLINNQNIFSPQQQSNILSTNPFKSGSAYSNLILGMKNKNLVSLEPFAKIFLNQQKKETKPINHNSPKWLEEYELEVSNNKTDKIVIEVYTRSVTLVDSHTPEDGVKFINTNKNLGESTFLGFQIFPIKFLEKINKKGETNSIWLRLINKSQDEYFVTDPKHVLNIDNHDPINYKVEDNIIQREKDIGVPLIKITYEYIDFYNLWLINCSVHSIIQKEDPKNKTKSIYIYRLFIRRNDELGLG